jgi:3-oxoacyl-[acyl-carrier protein] reductase
LPSSPAPAATSTGPLAWRWPPRVLPWSSTAGAIAGPIAAMGGQALPILADVADAPPSKAWLPGPSHVSAASTSSSIMWPCGPEKALLARRLPDRHGVLDVILAGAFLTVRATLEHLRASGAGAIVNIGGVSGHAGARQRAHVVTAKAGLVGLTRALAHELAADGITANCVVPGLIETERDPKVPLPQHHQVSRTLLGRLGSAEEIAAAVCFLCGPGARYITGQTLHVNGGVYLG